MLPGSVTAAAHHPRPLYKTVRTPTDESVWGTNMQYVTQLLAAQVMTLTMSYVFNRFRTVTPDLTLPRTHL